MAVTFGHVTTLFGIFGRVTGDRNGMQEHDEAIRRLQRSMKRSMHFEAILLELAQVGSISVGANEHEPFIRLRLSGERSLPRSYIQPVLANKLPSKGCLIRGKFKPSVVTTSKRLGRTNVPPSFYIAKSTPMASILPRDRLISNWLCIFLLGPRAKMIREILTASRMSCLKLKGLESQRAQWLLPL